jgi:hypothetical protein
VQRAAAAGRSTIRSCGGFTFAERPEVAAPDARIIWHAHRDPGTLSVAADPTAPGDPDGIDPARLDRWLTVVSDAAGAQHVVLSDGLHHIRLDVEAGGFVRGVPVALHYHLSGRATAVPRLLTLRRWLHLCRHRRFSPSLFPADPVVQRGILQLRVRDALDAGASQREIATALFGETRTVLDWTHRSESLRSRVRRLVAEAKAMTRGRYRLLMTLAKRRD